jgi:DNA polymerase-3 subunit alpha
MSKKNWVNFHNHTVYSLLDGHTKPKIYAGRAKELGMPAATITDHGNLFGWLPFIEACKKAEIKPILGLEAYQARKSRFDRDPEELSGPATNEWDQRGPYHLTIVARNMDGYKNLIKLSSLSYLEGYYGKPRIDHELLAQHASGLMVFSGCLNGEVQQALLRDDFDAALKAASTMQDIVGKDNYFIEIQDHDIEDQKKVKHRTLEIAKLIGARVVPTGDCHYTHKEDAEAHDAMLCISTKATIDQENRFKFHGDNFYLKSYEEMAVDFEEEWLYNSLIATEMINVDPKFGELYFPEFPLPKGVTNKDEYLEEQVWAGIRERYGEPIPEAVRERTDNELGVVRRMGFGDYFLVVSDLVGWAKAQGIRVGWGRGSAAGSILSYALRITNLDPLQYGLMFERFLVEGRKSMPDIDLDFDDRYREKVIQYARDKYGHDHVAHIGTFSSIGTLRAIRDATKVLGYDYKLGDRIAKMVPKPVLGVSKTIAEALETPDVAKAYKEDKKVKHIIDTAKGLEGIYRQPGIHAAGVVISQAPTMEFVPLMLGGEAKDIVVTQWDMDGVEQCGQLKIDFLGLRNLSVIDICVENIAKSQGTLIDVSEIPIDDAATYDALCHGNCMGVFQLESSGMRSMMLGLQPTCLDDIMALISLYRPGPLGSGMDKMFINRKHKRERVKYPHVALQEVLEPSHGVMLYQEDVLNVAKTLAGFTVPEADDLRKAIGKKQMDKIGLFRKQFVEGCKTVNDVQKSVADKIYSDIEYFGGYGFNRAHAASYAMVSYITAYLKTHYPAEYMAALMSTVTDEKDKLALYLNECRRMNLTVLSPSVTKSKRDFVVIDGEILFGLSAIKGIGDAYVDAILRGQNREYKTVYDYLRFCDPILLNKTIMENLTRSGAFDELIPFEDVRGVNRQERLEILNLEKEYIGIYVTDHPLLGVWDFLSNESSISIQDLESIPYGDRVKLPGIITTLTKKKTKRGADMYNLIFEDLTGFIEVIVFPRTAEKFPEEFFKEGSIGFLSATVNKEGDEEHPDIRLFFENFEPLDTSVLHGSRPMLLKAKDKLSREQIKRLRDIIVSVKGDSVVYLEYPEDNHSITLRFKEHTSLEVEEALRKVIEVSALEYKF